MQRRNEGSGFVVDGAACRLATWSMPSPISPSVPAWTAVRRETSGCDGVGVGLCMSSKRLGRSMTGQLSYGDMIREKPGGDLLGSFCRPARRANGRCFGERPRGGHQAAPVR